MHTGEIIKQILVEKGKKQKWLADKLNATDSKLCSMLKKDLQFEVLIKICKFLDVSINYIYEIHEKKEMSSATGKKLNPSQAQSSIS